MKILSRIINIKLGKTMRKKLASLFIMVVMTIGLVGCGKKKDVGNDDSSPEVTEASKDESETSDKETELETTEKEDNEIVTTETPEEKTTEEYIPVEMELLEIQWLLNILKVC